MYVAGEFAVCTPDRFELSGSELPVKEQSVIVRTFRPVAVFSGDVISDFAEFLAE